MTRLEAAYVQGATLMTAAGVASAACHLWPETLVFAGVAGWLGAGARRERKLLRATRADRGRA